MTQARAIPVILILVCFSLLAGASAPYTCPVDKTYARLSFGWGDPGAVDLRVGEMHTRNQINSFDDIGISAIELKWDYNNEGEYAFLQAYLDGYRQTTLAEGEQQTLAGGIVIKLTNTIQDVGGCTASTTGMMGTCPISNEKAYFDVTLPAAVSGLPSDEMFHIVLSEGERHDFSGGFVLFVSRMEETVGSCTFDRGSCSISNERAYIAFKLPPAAQGYGLFRTYINDYADRSTKDRSTTPFEGLGMNFTNTSNNYDSNEIKPVFAGGTYTTLGVINTSSSEVVDVMPHGRKIGGDEFPALATYALRDYYTGSPYLAEQSLWLYAGTVYDSAVGEVVANAPEVAYKTDFDPSGYGLRVSSCYDYSELPYSLITQETVYAGQNISVIGFETTPAHYYFQVVEVSEYGFNVAAYVKIYDAYGWIIEEKKLVPDVPVVWRAPSGDTFTLIMDEGNASPNPAEQWAYLVVYSGFTQNCTENDLTENHRVPIRFLGQDWIISGISPPEALSEPNQTYFSPNASDIAYTNASYIQLARETAYGVVHGDENISAGSYKVKLVNVGPTNPEGLHPAQIEIYDITNALLQEAEIYPGDTYVWHAPDGAYLHIRVHQTYHGYITETRWVEMSVYANVITLVHNEKVDNSDNKYWKTYLYWSVNPEKENVLTLKTVMLVKDYDGTLQLSEGQTLGLIANPTVFEVVYDGLDLDATDYDTLSMSIVTTAIAYSPTGSATCADATVLPTPASLLYVRSQIPSPFTVEGVQTDHFYVNLNGIAGHETYIYYKQSGVSCYFRKSVIFEGNVAYDLGDGSDQYLRFSVSSASSKYLTVYLEEMTSNPPVENDYLIFDLSNANGGVWSFNGSTNGNRAGYIAASKGIGFDSGPAQYGWDVFHVDPGFVTERGSVYQSMTTSSATVKFAKRVGEAVYRLRTLQSEVPSDRIVMAFGLNRIGDTLTIAGHEIHFEDVFCSAPVPPADVGMKYCEAVKGAYNIAYNTNSSSAEYSPYLDLNGDGRINLSDLAAFGNHYGKAKNGDLAERLWCLGVVDDMAGDPTPNLGMKYCEAVKGAFNVAYNTKTSDLEYSPVLDFNSDGKINLSDFAAFGKHYGSAKAGNLDEKYWCLEVVKNLAAEH